MVRYKISKPFNLRIKENNFEIISEGKFNLKKIKYMTTVINNPGNGDDSSGVAGMIIGVVVLMLIGALFFIYGLPLIRNGINNTPSKSIDINVKLPVDSGNALPTTPTAQ
jgi:hypothetical protein